MPKIETPEEFAYRIWGAIEKNWGDSKACYSAMSELVAARDAAIRAEQAEMLKMCGEVLNKAYQAIACPEGTRANFLLASASLDIKNALAALREAGGM